MPAGVTLLRVELSDQRKRGGVNFGYRLTIEPSGNDFELRLPATEVNVPKGGTALVNVNVGRRGYTGPVQLAVADLPAGLTVHGGDIPANGTAGVLTITAPAEAAIPAGALLRIEGKGTVDGKEIKRQALHKLVLSREVNPVSAVLTLPQVAVAVGEEQLFDYYRRILRTVALPVIVQDASGYVGRPMSIAFLARLFDEFGPRVMFKPEAVPIGPRLSALHAATGSRAGVFEGSGGIALVDSFKRGIVGTMPGADLVDAIVALWRALKLGSIVNGAPWRR